MTDEMTAETVHEAVVRRLRDGGLQLLPGDELPSVTDGIARASIVISEAREEAGVAQVEFLLGDDEHPRIHVAVFADATGLATGRVLVAGDATLAETLQGSGALRSTSVSTDIGAEPSGALDVCVAPIDEVAGWVRAELAELAEGDEDDDDPVE